MKKSFVLGLFFLAVACGGGSDKETTIPGIGPDPSISSVQNVDYRRTTIGQNCQASIFPSSVFVTQEGNALTIQSGGQTLATGTIDSSGNLQLSLLEAGTGGGNLSCSGLFNEGVVDMSCPVGSVTCEFTYTRTDVM